MQATLYERQVLRCSLCGETFTAPVPHAARHKYDPSVLAMLGMLTYRMGVPLNATAHLQESCGVPMPVGTQFELVNEGASRIKPVVAELVRRAANARLLHNDDTKKKILELTPVQRAALLGSEAGERTGVFTTAIIAHTYDSHLISLYFTGPRHAGENLAEVLKQRSPGLPPPLLMCDALGHNVPKEFEVIVCNCSSHGRRQFVDIVAQFQEEVRVILHFFRAIYAIDAQAREQKLTPEARLQLHREKSRPLMVQLALWMRGLLQGRTVEPNSTLGKAMSYLRKHWFKLTRFYRTHGAPLDNNIAERALKTAIRHRKNSLFYRTLNGAGVGDTYMTLIHTAELSGADALDYLTALLRNPEAVAAHPDRWLPWNYPRPQMRSAGPEPPT
jgi:hypothetical protein